MRFARLTSLVSVALPLAVAAYTAVAFYRVEWPKVQTQNLNLLLASRITVALVVAYLLAPLPLCLWWAGRRRAGAETASERWVGQAGSCLWAWLAVQAMLTVALYALDVRNRRAFLAAQGLVFAAGVVLWWRGRRAGALGPPVPAVAAYLAPLVGLVFFGCLAVCFGQDYCFDLRNYHYYNGYAFLNGRFDRDIAAAGVETYYNPVLDAGFYWLNEHLPPVWAGFLLGAAQGLSAVLLFGIAFLLLGRCPTLLAARLPLSLACALAGAYQPVFLFELGTSMNDALSAVPIFAGVLILVRGLVRPPAGRVWAGAGSVWLAGLLMGAAAGCKMTNLTFAAAAPVALMAAERGWRRLLMPAALGVGTAAGALLTDGYWMALLQTRFDSPLYPFANALFRSPFYPSEANIAYKEFLPKTPGEKWFYPFHWLWTQSRGMENPFRDARMAALYGLLALAIVVAPVRWCVGRLRGRVGLPRGVAAAGFVVLFLVVSYVVWEYQFSNLRYLSAALSLAPIACVLLLAALPLGRIVTPATAAAVLAGIVGWMWAPQYGRAPWYPTFVVAHMPPLKLEADQLVVLSWEKPGDIVPVSFIATSLPRELRFIKIDSPSVEYNALVRQRVRCNLGPVGRTIYLLTPAGGEAIGLAKARKYELVPTGPGAMIHGNFEPPLTITPMVQVPGLDATDPAALNVSPPAGAAG